MKPEEIIQAALLAAKLASELYSAVQASRAAISEQDEAKLKAALKPLLATTFADLDRTIAKLDEAGKLPD